MELLEDAICEAMLAKMAGRHDSATLYKKSQHEGITSEEKTARYLQFHRVPIQDVMSAICDVMSSAPE